MKKIYDQYKALFIGIFVFLLIGSLICIIILSIWKIYFPKKYQWDLSFDISDILQLFVITIALFGPFVYSYVTKRSQIPIIDLIYNPNKPFIFRKYKYYFPSDKNIPQGPATYACHHCVKILNNGKTRLLNCEGVIINIWRIAENRFIKLEDKPQIVLKWLEGEFRKGTIDINPGREERLALFFFPEDSKMPSPSGIKLTIYHASDTVNEMEMLEFGEYIFLIKVFSSNADIKDYYFKIEFSKGSQMKGVWKPNCKTTFLNNKPNSI